MVKMAAQSKACTVFYRSNTGIVASNPNAWINFLCIYTFLCGVGLTTVVPTSKEGCKIPLK
jgi:hypothetical protein